MIDRPIAVISYNRPDLLERFLTSLKEQTVTVDPARVALFQDHGDQAEADCVAVFRAAFPEGEVFQSDTNLGVALNIDRAERHVFETLGADVAYFFEDDLILGPHYLEALGQLSDFALSEERVGYVAAYGNHRASAEEQAERSGEIVPMDHIWGFALLRRQWERQKPIIEPYLEIIRQRPYRERDEEAIKEYYRSLGYPSIVTSQDGAKHVASLALGTIRLMSFACFAKYEGSEGLHMNPELFKKLGYSDMTVFDGPPDFDLPSSEQLDQWIERLRGDMLAQARARENPPSVAPAAEPAPTAEPATFGRWSVADIPSVPHMDEDGRALLETRLGDARCLLEYGAGGSSMTAARLKVPTILSVESDADFLAATGTAVRAAATHSAFVDHHADIGPIREWGNPADRSKVHLWPRYSSGIWARIARERLPQPDLVLIDGRFRIACLLATALMGQPGTRILFDDYFDRPGYHRVEAWLKPIGRAGRMAEFIVPDVPADRMMIAELLAASTDFG
jgi:hypothetical protein